MRTEDVATNRFGDCLAWGEREDDEPFWAEVYSRAFPGYVGSIQNGRNNAAQRTGIDRVVFLSSGRTILVDEKKRTTDFGDFALEWKHVHTDGHEEPGWIQKDLAIDFLAYAFMPSRRCFLLPWDGLKRVWTERHRHWIENGYPVVRAPNGGYVTLSIAVPIRELLNAIAQTMAITLDAEPAE